MICAGLNATVTKLNADTGAAVNTLNRQLTDLRSGAVGEFPSSVKEQSNFW